MIIATAGHVDHGKTSLVKALTGVDTDTLAEEKTRGLSINLGYAYVPSDHQETLGFIDVPGHQRFINNMIAGVSGIDRALLVVAADDGPMPQTLEHLDVLALLGLSQLDLVITKVDRCEEARAEQVAEQTQALVTQRLGTRADVFYVSSVTGDGIEALRQHLKKAVPRRHTGGDQQGFRLSIDRRFHVKGAGIVVTGTASAGQVALGETLTLLPQGAQVRVRDLRANDQVTDRAQTGQRVALCVTGKVQLEDIERGHCLTDPTLACPSQRVDAEVSILAHSPNGLKHLTPVKVYIGAQRLSARIALIDHAGSTLQPGDQSLVQLIFDSSVSTFTGERFLIRDDSESINLGGGRVLDPWGPKYGKSKSGRVQWLSALKAENAEEALQRLVLERPCVDWRYLARCYNQKPDAPLPTLPKGIISFTKDGATWVATATSLANTRNVILNAVEQDRNTQVETHGLAKPQLVLQAARKTHVAIVRAVLEVLLKDGTLVLADGRIVSAQSINRSDPTIAHWLAMRDELKIARLDVPVLSDLRSRIGLTELELKIAIKHGMSNAELHRINATRYAMADTLRHIATGIIVLAGDRPFTVVEVKEHFAIGRKLTIELLEFFDSINVTQRNGNARVISNAKVIKQRFGD